GIGIDPEDLPYIFKLFYRADKARSSDSGGMGLGLAICKSIIEAHGGDITVESKPNTGSIFCIRLPAS
ncbi:MAG: sensor histidine kinase, partial [Chloroflexota bacterium]